MIAWMPLLVLIAAPTIEVSLAPDQPVPYIFVGEPLILQIKSSDDVKATGHIEIVGEDEKSVVVALPEMALRANGTHWQSIDGAPAIKGRFVTHVKLDLAGSPFETHLVYCRIDRPAAGVSAPIAVRMNGPDPSVSHALKGIPARRVVFMADAADLEALVKEADTQGLLVSIVIEPQKFPDPAAVESLVATLNDHVESWIVEPNGAGVQAAEPLAAAIRRAGSRAPVAVSIGDDEDAATMFANGLGRIANQIVLRSDTPTRPLIAGLRHAARSAGYEGFAVSTYCPGGPTPPAAVSSDLVRQLILNEGAGVICAELAPALVFGESGFSASYAQLSALAHVLNHATYAGELQFSPPVYAQVFRNGGSWILAVWNAEAPSEVTLPIGLASGLALADARNNALPVPATSEGALRLQVGREPKYVRGEGGSVLAHAARGMALKEAEAFGKNASFQRDLPKELTDIVKLIQSSRTGRIDRVNFFALLRMFPLLELQWHDGTLRRDVAVPAMAAVSGIVRHLCVLEQEANEPFIELLNETIARCGEYQSQYLTSTGGTTDTHERADWLLAEVGRLTAEAKTLAEAGRGIEAVGIASLAEWRARCLEIALRAAPLGTPEPPRVEESPKPQPKPAAPKPARKK